MPAFHAAYLEAMVQVFDTCAARTVDKLDSLLSKAERNGKTQIEVEMESEYSNLALDIIGLSVFNYDFGSVTRESPVIAVRMLPISPCTYYYFRPLRILGIGKELVNN